MKTLFHDRTDNGGQCNACNEHGDGRIDLDIGTSIYCHIRVDLMSLAKVNWIS